MSVIDQAQLDDWSAHFDDLLPVAIDNLDEQPHLGWTSIYKQTYASMDSDDYAGARMLVPGYLGLSGLSGELVVLHPHRSQLVVAACDDARGIAKACEYALDQVGAPSPVSFQPLVGQARDSGGPLVLSPSHPAHEVCQRLVLPRRPDDPQQPPPAPPGPPGQRRAWWPSTTSCRPPTDPTGRSPPGPRGFPACCPGPTSIRLVNRGPEPA